MAKKNKFQKTFLVFAFCFLGMFEASFGAQEQTTEMSGKPMHVSANKSIRDLKRNRLEMFGNVYVRRPQELLTADYAVLELNNEHIVAEGNVAYYTPNSVIYGSKMDFNYVTGTGTILDGRVETNQYQLIGDYLERLGEDEFYGKESEYTTCRDCPSSWKIHGSHLRMTVNGYARITNMFIKVNDMPLLYFPYIVIPVKTRRQTGLLFPKLKSGTVHGFQYVQPFFWAISRTQDATFGFGKLTARGWKAEVEHRYILGSRSHGQINGFFLNDRTFVTPYEKRWALHSTHQWELPGKVDFKFHWLDASDRDYARLFPDDIPGHGEPGLVSEMGLSKATSDFAVWATAKRIKKTLRLPLVGFDNAQVQEVPSVSLTSTDHRFYQGLPLFWSSRFNFKRFWRKEGTFDLLPGPQGASTDFVPGRDPLREGYRFHLVPEIYYTAKLFNIFDLVPSAQFRGFYYLFDHPNMVPARRGYLVTNAELSTNFERVYTNIKHRFRPSLTYSVIPYVLENKSHPFVKQLEFGTGNVIGTQTGRQFDDYDIVPYSFDAPQYFVPLGHSLTYELANFFILKTTEPADGFVMPSSEEEAREITRAPPSAAPQYRKIVDLYAGQTVNFVEFRKTNPDDERPFSRAYTILNVNTPPFQNRTEVFYYPYIKAFQLNTGITYTLARFRKRLLNFERSFNISYSRNKVTSLNNVISANINWSFNDYFMIGLSRQLDLLTQRTVSTAGKLIFQSPSQCYQVTLNVSQTVDRGFEIAPNLVINLTGQGFTGIMDGSATANNPIMPGGTQ